MCDTWHGKKLRVASRKTTRRFFSATRGVCQKEAWKTKYRRKLSKMFGASEENTYLCTQKGEREGLDKFLTFLYSNFKEKDDRQESRRKSRVRMARRKGVFPGGSECQCG